MEAELSLRYEHRLVLSWACAGLLALLLRTSGRRWHLSLGVALMTVPLWLTAWNFVNSFQVLADPDSRLATYSRSTLSRIWSRSILVDAGYVLTGLLVWASGGRWKDLWTTGPRRLAATARDAGIPLWRSERASVAAGLVAFPVFLVATYGANEIIYGQAALVNGDETRVWAAMTPYHLLLLSLVAGFGEEILYRGLLMGGLRRFLPAWAAIGTQAVVFGFAHAGYGTIAHVLLPVLFGLIAGYAAYRFGIWSAIVLHVLVDVFAFAGDAVDEFAWLEPALLGFLVLNVLFTAVVSARWIAAWTRRRRVEAG